MSEDVPGTSWEGSAPQSTSPQPGYSYTQPTDPYYAQQPGQQYPPQPEQTYYAPQGQQQYAQQPSSRTAGIGSAHKDKWVASILAFFLGALGIHKFYLGYKTEGIIMLVVSLVGGVCLLGLGTFVMMIIAYVEAVRYLILTQEDFEQVYVRGSKSWF
jgi:TM2 domain-containing membrane protein YozV